MMKRNVKEAIAKLSLVAVVLVMFTVNVHAATLIDEIDLPADTFTNVVSGDDSYMYVGMANGKYGLLARYDVTTLVPEYYEGLAPGDESYSIPNNLLSAGNGGKLFMRAFESSRIRIFENTTLTLVASIDLDEEFRNWCCFTFGTYEVLAVTTAVDLRLYDADNGALLASTVFLNDNPRGIIYSQTNSTLYTCLWDLDTDESKLFAAIVTDNGGVINLSLLMVDTIAKPVLPVLHPNGVDVIVVAHEGIAYHDKGSLYMHTTYPSIDNVADVEARPDKLLVLSRLDMTAPELVWQGGLSIFDYNGSEVRTWYPDSLLLRLCKVGDPGVCYVLDHGPATGNPVTPPGALMEIDLATGTVLDSYPLSGMNFDFFYCPTNGYLYILELEDNKVIVLDP